MIKKQYIYFILLAGVLTTLVLLLRKAQNEETNSTHNQRLSDFAIEDTSSIDRIVITDANGGRAEVIKKSQDYWQLNGKYKARIDAIHIIMKTAKQISVKSEVPASATKTVLSTISVGYKKVEYYSGNTYLRPGMWVIKHAMVMALICYSNILMNPDRQCHTSWK